MSSKTTEFLIFSRCSRCSISVRNRRHENEAKAESLEEHKDYYGVPTENAYKYMIDRISVSAKKQRFLYRRFFGIFRRYVAMGFH